MKRTALTLSLTIIASASFAETILTDSPAMLAITNALSLDSTDTEVVLALDPDQSLHHFALKPSQARAMSNADYLVTIGENLFPQINEAFTSLNPDATTISIAETLDHDPHFWVSPQKAIEAAKLIDNQLPSRDPSGELLQHFVQTMTELDEQLQKVAFERGIMVGHNAFGGFTETYDIPFFGALTDEHDHAATPKDHHEIDHAIEDGDVSCLILDAAEPSPDHEKFAAEHGIDFVYVDVSGWKFIEPNTESFFTNYYRELEQAFSNCAIPEQAPLTAQ